MLPVVYMPAAEKYFRKLKDKALKEKYKKAIEEIRKNPYIGKYKKGDLEGIMTVDVYYDKTNYEIAYRVSMLENGDILVIIMAGTRENFYKELKRYL